MVYSVPLWIDQEANLLSHDRAADDCKENLPPVQNRNDGPTRRAKMGEQKMSQESWEEERVGGYLSERTAAGDSQRQELDDDDEDLIELLASIECLSTSSVVFSMVDPFPDDCTRPEDAESEVGMYDDPDISYQEWESLGFAPQSWIRSVQRTELAD